MKTELLFHKKLLSNILDSLKDKLETKKKPYGIQHYHWHYYPVVHPLSGSFTKAPKKHELDGLHHDSLTSLGWSHYEYNHIPQPKIKIPSSLSHSWDTIILEPTHHEIVEVDHPETADHSEHDSILVEVPGNKNIYIGSEHPKDLKEVKYGLLASLFHKSSSSSNHI
ncbi:uncharacterized protein LOC143217448 isoform X2 [Lasioglossum baleicum]|uniref:uncharacterized protein LOC143217448 isoform X2 n=1 Tax=Lasioglossum baleicum TaxID=434251 RepID=UPI003FCE59D8